MSIRKNPTAAIGVVLATCLAMAGLGAALLSLHASGRQAKASPDAAALISSWLGGARVPPWLNDPNFGRTHKTVRELYAARSWRPTWLEGGRPTPQALELTRLLAAAAERGLRPRDYQAAVWPHRWESAALSDARGHAQLDLLFSATVAAFVHDLRFGRIDPRTLGVRGKDLHDRALAATLARLTSANDVEATLRDLVEPRHRPYHRLLEELRRLRAGDDPGRYPRIAQVELALERWRWLPRDLDGPTIVVNVPEFRLRAYGASGEAELEMNVVVGDARGSATPLFSEELRTVVFQPAWYVPKSIVRNELVPSEEREPGYLSAHGYEILGEDGAGASGRPDAETLAALREGRLGIRQRPGPGNALGRVKFLFPNPHGVYMHDTPVRAAFSRERRDLSHGCVRVADPDALARWALRGVPGWDDRRVDDALNGSETLAVELLRPIRVVLVYHTAVVGDDGIRFLDDLYGLDATLREAITADLDPAARLDYQRRTRPVSTWTKSDSA